MERGGGGVKIVFELIYGNSQGFWSGSILEKTSRDLTTK